MNFTKLALIASLSLKQPPSPPKRRKRLTSARKTSRNRIAQGDKSGQITAGETSHLEKQESAINREERNMRPRDNGHLTKADKSLINKQQNQESRRIYRDKHNGKVR